jgi:ribonucleoside-triphosphate reductase (thioredoxin)
MTNFSFRLNTGFIDSFSKRTPDWGFQDAGGNSVGELTFIRTYSRVKEDGSKEKWFEVCRRVIEGMYSIQKNHAKRNSLPWNDNKAQKSAQEAYDRMFAFKWTPPGRGLWVGGTDFVMSEENGSAMQNCSFISTGDMDKSDPGALFGLVFEQLMLGVGVGWDTMGKYKDIQIHLPDDQKREFVIQDSREGWADSVRMLINSYLKPNQHRVVFDYIEIRPYGSPIKGFGGVASGPEPLQKLHDKVSSIFEARVGDTLGTEIIADLMNLIGTCVVAGNVRRSAELGMGEADDEVFLNLKNAEAFPERNSYDPANPGWSYMSNNSLSVKVGQDYSPFIDRITSNGEPGFIWLDVARQYGRLCEAPNNKDYRVAGFNPCVEQSLESQEMCTLVEVHINRAESKEDFLRTLKFAYLYGKTVTLMKTHWAATNAIMSRNHRIGTGTTGVVNFLEKNSLEDLREWWDTGYKKIQYYDKKYSEWLCVRESIKTTTIKPSGTTSLLSGATPGVHWPPAGPYYLRAIRMSSDNELLPLLRDAGYTIEDDLHSSNTSVVYFPVKTDVKRSDTDVSIFEKIHLASEAQRYWSDNSVSVTVSFKPEERGHISNILSMYEGKLKSVSFLPMGNDTYPQMPYTSITEEEYWKYWEVLQPVDMSVLYGIGEDAVGDKYCTTDVCEIKTNG